MDRVGVGLRAVAIIIDSLIWGVAACCVILPVALLTGDNEFEATGGPAWALNALFGILYLGYFIVMEGTSGATLGKRLMKIKVVRRDGTRIDIRDSLIRNILRIIDGIFSYLVGAIIIWTSPDKQRLGDKLANTIVVRDAPTTAVPHERF